MSSPWLEKVGRPVVYAIAKEEKVELSPKLLKFLEKFGDAVAIAARRNAAVARRAAHARQELDKVYDVVQQELRSVQNSLRASALQEINQIQVLRDVETRLPKVFLTLEALPTMVIHVDRAYATRGKGCTYGFRCKDGVGATMTGKVGQAANYVKEVCRKKDWQLSVSDLVTLWVMQALEIPLMYRREGSASAITKGSVSAAGKAPPARRGRPRKDSLAEAGVLFERTPSPRSPRPATSSRAGLGSKKRRRTDSEASSGAHVTRNEPSLPLPSRKKTSSVSPTQKAPAKSTAKLPVKAPVSEPRPRKTLSSSEPKQPSKPKKTTNSLGLSDAQMEAFMENRAANDRIAKHNMQVAREEKGLPSPPTPTRRGSAKGKSTVVGSRISKGKPVSKPIASASVRPLAGTSRSSSPPPPRGEASVVVNMLTVNRDSPPLRLQTGPPDNRDAVSEMPLSHTSGRTADEQCTTMNTQNVKLEKKELVLATGGGRDAESTGISSDMGRVSISAAATKRKEEIVASGGGTPPPAGGATSQARAAALVKRRKRETVIARTGAEEVVASGGGNGWERAKPLGTKMEVDAPTADSLYGGDEISISFVAHTFDIPPGPAISQAESTPLRRETSEQRATVKASGRVAKREKVVHEELVGSGGW